MARVPGMRAWLETQLNNQTPKPAGKPFWTARRVLDRVINITVAENLRLRSKINPPDLMLTPDVGSIGPIEFYRAKDAIAAGRRAAEESLPALRRLPQSYVPPGALE
jgi:NTE family protein